MFKNIFSEYRIRNNYNKELNKLTKKFLEEFKDTNLEAMNAWRFRWVSDNQSFNLYKKGEKEPVSYIGLVTKHRLVDVKTSKSQVIPYISFVYTPKKYRKLGYMKKIMNLFETKDKSESFSLRTSNSNLYKDYASKPFQKIYRISESGKYLEFDYKIAIAKMDNCLNLKDIYLSFAKKYFHAYKERNENDFASLVLDYELYGYDFLVAKNSYFVIDADGMLIDYAWSLKEEFQYVLQVLIKQKYINQILVLSEKILEEIKFLDPKEISSYDGYEFLYYKNANYDKKFILNYDFV